MRRILELLDNSMRDILAFGGLGMASYGASMAYPPAGYILFGGALFWIGVRR